MNKARRLLAEPDRDAATAQRATGASLTKPIPLPPAVEDHRAKRRLDAVIDRLEHGLVPKGAPVPTTSPPRMDHGSAARRDCAQLAPRLGSMLEHRARRALLRRVLQQHRDPSARAHAAFRLGREQWGETGPPHQILRELERARTRDPATIVTTAASAALTTIRNTTARADGTDQARTAAAEEPEPARRPAVTAPDRYSPSSQRNRKSAPSGATQRKSSLRTAADQRIRQV